MKVLPSREKVKCGQPACGFHGEKRGLIRHYARKHPGMAILVQNASFGVGGTWNSWVQGRGDSELLSYAM